ncbi:MAG TPA: sulfite exporter TauE/SafE family protein, partial [Candidatus Lambdaproteobacteria bacterium]|nr:sulfite exporter TauE/SafE family protein [Candidatus Lambdaproteobacteria bacterium]
GFSALTVTSLSLILPPAEVVPSAFMLEIAASIYMLPLVWRTVNWKVLRWLLLGVVLGTPFGITVLTTVPQKPMQLLISVIVLAASLLLWKKSQTSQTVNRGWTFGVGCISGLINGAAAIGGLPVVLLFLFISAGSASTRASMVAYLFIIDLYAVFLPGSQQLISTELLGRTVLLLIPLFLGIYIGHRSFVKTSPESFRKFALSLLIVLSLAGMIRGILL